MKRGQDIDAVFSNVRRASKRLTDWMRINHDDLLCELGNDRVNWRATMAVIEKLHLVDDRGNPPSKDTTFRTWKRVKREVAAERAPERKHRNEVKIGEVAPGVLALNGPTRPASEAARIEIRSARPNVTSSQFSSQTLAPYNNQSDLSVTTSTVAGEDADNQIRRVFDEMGAGRTPMPKVRE